MLLFWNYSCNLCENYLFYIILKDPTFAGGFNYWQLEVWLDGCLDKICDACDGLLIYMAEIAELIFTCYKSNYKMGSIPIIFGMLKQDIHKEIINPSKEKRIEK